MIFEQLTVVNLQREQYEFEHSLDAFKNSSPSIFDTEFLPGVQHTIVPSIRSE